MRKAAAIAMTASILVFLAFGLAAFSSIGPAQKIPDKNPPRIFYVATDGNDAYDGLAPARQKGSRGPFRTFQRAANAARAGDTVQIRGGTYAGGGSWGYDYSGTESNPITLTAYPGETVVIDGAHHTQPTNPYTPLMQVYGNWFNVSNFEFRYGSYAGLNIAGDRCTVRNVYGHHNQGPGIFVSGEYDSIENCRVYYNSMDNEFGAMSNGWGFGISLCANARYSTVRNCSSWNNWGEGISIASGYYCTIEDCVSYDNFTVNIYISQSVGGVCQRNLSYYTPGNPLQGYASSQNCIYAGDEGNPPESTGNKIINNLCMGGDRCLLVAGDDFENTLIAYNTFVNAFHRLRESDGASVYFLSGSSTGGRFVNNIILQEDSVPVSHLEGRGIDFRGNSWSKRPVSGCRGAADVIGDPKLMRTGPTGPGSLRREWFKISEISPVRDRAEPLREVGEDMFKQPRGGKPDMGAYEVPDRPRRARSGRAIAPRGG